MTWEDVIVGYSRESESWRFGDSVAGAQFVFGYGSLVTAGRRPEGTQAGYIADLLGHRRTWGTAMDNSSDVPGYKYYVDDRNRRPDVVITFLDIQPHPGHRVNGICLLVTDERLADLDSRERNYQRVDVTSQMSAAPRHARVWAYSGSPGGRRRATQGRAESRAVIHEGYLESVRDGFARLGRAELELFDRSTESADAAGLRTSRLRRHDIPPP